MLSAVFCTLLVALSLIASVLGQTPTVTIRLSDPQSNGLNIVARRDTDVTMDCYVENLPVETTVRWQRTYRAPNGNMSVLSLSQDMALEDNIHYSIEKPTQFTWKLRVRAIQVTDVGVYQCFVLTTLNSRAKDERHITVVVQPYLDQQHTSSDQGANQGEDIDLTCNATGRPEPTIEWSRLGGALLPIGQEKLQSSLLQIVNIQPQDRGVYRCVAANSVGTAQTDIKIDVRFAPILNAPRVLIYQAIGYRVELQCYGEGNPIPKSYDSSWVKDATTYTTASDGYDVRFVQGAFGRVTYELIIYNVQESNFGVYMCRMKNSMGVTTQQITLAKSATPQASIKLGKVMAGASTPRGWPVLVTSLVTLLLCLVRIFD